jgi:Flp pilus assembly protein TadD
MAACAAALLAVHLYAENAAAPPADALAARVHNKAGMELLANRDFPGAAARFQLAITLDPSVKFYHNNIAVACMNQGLYLQAAAHLERALSLDGHYARALTNMAISRFHLSEYRGAYHYYRKAVAADRAYTGERFNLAKVILGMEKLQRDNPDDEKLKVILRRVRDLERMP